AGTVSSTDNILQAIQKLNGNNSTNANLTGPIISIGNATAVASQTGTGSTFVMNASPTLVTPVLGVATATSINGSTIPTSKTLVVTTDKLNVLSSTTSTELAGVISDETGTGGFVLSTSPTLVTPVLGVATATSINGSTIPTSKTLVVTTDKLNVLSATTSAELAGVISDETGTGSLVLSTSPTLVTPSLGTPSALVGTNITGTAAGLTAGNVTTNANLTGEITSIGNAATVPNATVIGKVLTGYASGAGTVSSTDNILQAIQKLNGNNSTNANLTGPIISIGNATAVASQTGTGSIFVMNASPTLVTPVLGVATATSINGSTIPTSKTLVVTTDKLNVLSSTTSAELAGVISDETGTGSLVLSTSPTLVTPVLGVATATSINGSAIPTSKTLVVTTDKLNILSATTSAELAGVISDETGTGSLVLSTSPALVTPVLGVATATSINGSTIPTSKTLVVTTDKLNILSATTSAELAGVIS
ncbi:hypothetical protein SAMN05444396_1261, partial [Flavobacterium segetis]